MTVSIVIPSFRRPADLARCLDALARQSRRADEVVVVRRRADAETAAVLAARGDVRECVVDEPGVLAAMTAGARAATGQVIAFLDDDTEPQENWLARILAHFDDPRVGGAGGRDVVVGGGDRAARTEDVGRVTRFGKIVGNHHVGRGAPRDVQVLKGANMAFRREALALPAGLRGAGAQPHFEVAASLWALARGWRLVYDPSARVLHRPGARFDADRRGRPEPSAIRDAAFNQVAALLAGAPQLAARRAAYGVLVGDRSAPGLVRAAAALVRRERDVVRSLVPSLRGQLGALASHAAGRGLAVDPILAGRRKPRVALVAHDVHPHGGMERCLWELVARTHDRVDYVVVSSTLDPALRPFVEWRRVRVPARPFPLKFATFFARAPFALRGARCDLVHTTGALVPTRADLATVHFCHAEFVRAAGALALPPASRMRWLNSTVARALALAAERWCYRPERLRAAAAVSTGVAGEIGRHYPQVPVVVTPNGVDADRFAGDGDARARGGRLVVLFVGGEWPRKGLPVAVEAVARAVARGADLELRVVGRGDAAALARDAAAAGIADRVRCLGPRADVEALYADADVFVLPSLYETFSLAAYEAAAAGVPVVATRVSGVDELIDAGAALAVERDAESVAEALVRLAGDASLRARLGARGRELASSFDWDHSTASVVDVYDRLLEEVPA